METKKNKEYLQIVVKEARVEHLPLRCLPSQTRLLRAAALRQRRKKQQQRKKRKMLLQMLLLTLSIWVS